MFSKFTSLYEFFGGLSIAFIGFSKLRTFYAQRAVENRLSLSKKIDDLCINAYKTQEAVAVFSDSIGRNNLSNGSIKTLEQLSLLREEIDREFESGGPSKPVETTTTDPETKISENLFVNGSIVSALFVGLFLLMAGLEDEYGDICLLIINYLFILIVIAGLLFPLILFSGFLRKIIKYNRKIYVACWFFSFVGVSCVLVAITIHQHEAYYVFDPSILLFVSFLLCFSSVISLAYRHLYYFLFKRIKLNLKINKYKKKLDKLKVQFKSELF